MVGCSFKNSDITRHLEVGKGRGGGGNGIAKFGVGTDAKWLWRQQCKGWDGKLWAPEACHGALVGIKVLKPAKVVWFSSFPELLSASNQ